MSGKKKRAPLVRTILLMFIGFSTVFVLFNFPYHWDPQPKNVKRVAQAVPTGAKANGFYSDVYAPADSGEAGKVSDSAYVQSVSAHSDDVKKAIRGFVRLYHLADKKVLDVGAGSGYLQDAVENYTGLDIVPEAARYFHKKFVVGSATDMPFADGEFDALWTIWVLEHVPNPERALAEMRRVVKPGGYLFLAPAWNVPSWLSGGYDVQPYSAFGWQGKLIKASIPMRKLRLADGMYLGQIRMLRHLASLVGPTRLRYHLLNPNYETYWEHDSDAVNSIDPYEVYLWHLSRGDRCLNCGDFRRALWSPPIALIIQKQ